MQQRKLANYPSMSILFLFLQEIFYTLLQIQEKMNFSNGSTTSPSVTRPFLHPWFVAFCVEALIIVCGNLITILAFVSRKTSKNRKFLLLINLSIADLLVGAIPLPLYLAYLGGELSFWNIHWGVPLEITLFGLDVLLGFASLTTLTVISLERVYATVVPIGYRGLNSRNYLFSIALIWSVASTTTVVCLISNFVLKSMKIATYVSMSLLSVLCSVISVSYVTIWHRIKFKRRIIRQKTNEYENKLALTLFIVTLTSLAAWLPFVIVNVLFVFSSVHFSFNFIYFSKVLHYGNSFVNPIVYSLRMPEFRSSVVRMFSTRSSQRKLAADQQLSKVCSVAEDGQDTFRSNRRTQHEDGEKPDSRGGKNTTVTWRKSTPQEASVLLTDIGDTEKF